MKIVTSRRSAAAFPIALMIISAGVALAHEALAADTISLSPNTAFNNETKTITITLGADAQSPAYPVGSSVTFTLHGNATTFEALMDPDSDPSAPTVTVDFGDVGNGVQATGGSYDVELAAPGAAFADSCVSCFQVLEAPPSPTASTSASGPPCAEPKASSSASAPASSSASPSGSQSASPSASSSGAAACDRSTLTVALSRSDITPGVVVSVTVHGSPDAGVELWAYSRPHTEYARVRSDTTDANGSITFSVKPGTNTRLYAHYESGSADTDSASKVLYVHSALSLSAYRDGVRQYHFQGQILPHLAGQLVTLYRLDNGSELRTASVKTDASGVWRIDRTFTGSGTFTFVARTGRTPNNEPGRSNERRVIIY
jgi:hypothetical protein